MANAKHPDETESLAIRRGFDQRLITEYLLVFIRSHSGNDGHVVDEDSVWDKLVKTLDIQGTTGWRIVSGVDKSGKMPLSPFDGLPERRRPSLDEVFRYVAALNLAIESIGFPPGRIIVNRAMARALTGFRRKNTGEERRITDIEVERLRYLRHWRYAHRTGSARIVPRFTLETVRDMCLANTDKAMGSLEMSPAFVESLTRLFFDWNVTMTEFYTHVSYPWVY